MMLCTLCLPPFPRTLSHSPLVIYWDQPFSIETLPLLNISLSYFFPPIHLVLVAPSSCGLSATSKSSLFSFTSSSVSFHLYPCLRGQLRPLWLHNAILFPLFFPSLRILFVLTPCLLLFQFRLPNCVPSHFRPFRTLRLASFEDTTINSWSFSHPTPGSLGEDS